MKNVGFSKVNMRTKNFWNPHEIHLPAVTDVSRWKYYVGTYVALRGYIGRYTSRGVGIRRATLQSGGQWRLGRPEKEHVARATFFRLLFERPPWIWNYRNVFTNKTRPYPQHKSLHVGLKIQFSFPIRKDSARLYFRNQFRTQNACKQ